MRTVTVKLTGKEADALALIIANGWGDGDFNGWGGANPRVQKNAMRKFDEAREKAPPKKALHRATKGA